MLVVCKWSLTGLVISKRINGVWTRWEQWEDWQGNKEWRKV